jgi:hypothetical protein
MKNTRKALLSLMCVALCAVFFACASGGGGSAATGLGTPTLATGDWMAYNDQEGDGGSSTSSIVSAEEVIDGKTVLVHHVKGNVTTKFQYGFAGWGLNHDDATLELLKKAKAVSFWILGDGKRYTIKFKTGKISDYGYFEYSFNTEADTALYVEVPIKYFMQPSWATPVGSLSMYQGLALGVEWQTHESWRKDPNNNPFEIKTWDFTIYN